MKLFNKIWLKNTPTFQLRIVPINWWSKSLCVSVCGGGGEYGLVVSSLANNLCSILGNCAHYQKGGWWYNACAHSNLNGVWYRGGHYRSRYQDGVYWAEFRGGSYSLKKVIMMIRPNPNTFHWVQDRLTWKSKKDLPTLVALLFSSFWFRICKRISWHA